MRDARFTVSRRMQIMINHYAIPLAPDASQRHLCLKDFERADVRVAERRFGQGTSSTPPAIPMASFISCSKARCVCTRSTAITKEATVALLTHGDVFGETCLEEMPARSLRRGGHRIRVAVVRVCPQRGHKAPPDVRLEAVPLPFRSALDNPRRRSRSLLEGSYQRVWPRCSRTSATASGA